MSSEKTKKDLIAVEAEGLQISISGTHIILTVPAASKDADPIVIDMLNGMSKMSRNDRCLVHDYAFGLLSDKFDQIDKEQKAEKDKAEKAIKAEEAKIARAKIDAQAEKEAADLKTKKDAEAKAKADAKKTKK